MSGSRKNAAPYPAQLRKLLANPNGTRTFSPATLADVFDVRPTEAKRTTINSIHQALRQAWEAGDVVAYVNADGEDLREPEFCVNGSTAVAHPQIFGLPGEPSPVEGYTPVSYQEHLDAQHARGGAPAADPHPAGADDRDPAENPPADDEPAGDAEAVAAGDDQDAEDAEVGAAIEKEFTVEACLEQIADYRGEEPAPDWLPDRLLVHLVTLPNVVRMLRRGLDRAQGDEKLQLIATGLRRKGEVDPVTAGKLAAWCRRSCDWWRHVFFEAVDQYKEWGEEVATEDLPELRRAPDAFFLRFEEDYHPEAMVLWGIQLDADGELLRAVAQEAVAALDEETVQQTVTVQDQLRHQADALGAEVAELRRQLAERGTTVRAREQRISELTAEVETLRAAERRAGSADEQLAEAQQAVSRQRDELADLRQRLEAAQAHAAAATDAQDRAAALEREHDELSVRAAAGDQERRLRERAETLLQEQAAELLRLERELSEAAGVQVPVSDGAALMRALAGPVGEAAALAGRRLADGTQLPDDPKLLEFAGIVSQLTASLSPADPDADTAAALAPAVDGVAPEASPEQAAAPAPEPAAERAEPEEPAEPAASEPAGVSAPAPARRRSRRTAAFAVRPFGGAGEVGGSAIVVSTRAGHTVLLDAGQRVKGEYGLDALSPFHYSLPGVEALDAIVISHAHIDHIGSLPLLHSEFQRHHGDDPLPVLMSEPTRRVGEVMLADSAKIQHKRRYLTSGAMAELAQSDFAPQLDLKPAYDTREINAVLNDDVLRIIEPRQPFLIPGTSITVSLIPVAHVLGSCAVHLTDNETGATLLYTGDLGPLTEPQRTLPDFDGVNGFAPADVVIMESTYAIPTDAEMEMRRVDGREDNLKKLYKAARKAFESGGKVLLPAFSLGRTQELLRVIEDATATKEMPNGDVFIGGMGETLTRIYDDYRGSMWVAPGQMSRASEINRRLKDDRSFEDVVDELVSREEFAYIIVSPAMLSGGWSRAFVHRMIEDERHAVVFTGYLPQHGGGIRNLSGLHTGSKFPLDERMVEIKCAWRKATLSAHAPQQDLREFAKRMLLGGKEVAFGMVHGSPRAEEALAADVNGLDGATAIALSNGVPWSPQHSR
jgi:Cft2 family RNA processing exonuclease